MENKRDIPYGVINWATLVRECLFVDNTAYIRSLEKVTAEELCDTANEIFDTSRFSTLVFDPEEE